MQRDFTLQTGHASQSQAAETGTEQSERNTPAQGSSWVQPDIDARVMPTQVVADEESGHKTDSASTYDGVNEYDVMQMTSTVASHEEPPWISASFEVYNGNELGQTLADAQRDVDELNAQLAAQAEADDDVSDY